MLIRILACSILILAGLTRFALGVELGPFPVRNFSPLALVRGLPVADPARLNRPGSYTARLGLDIANNATETEREKESILLDGETYVATLGVRYGIAEGLQLGLDLPWVGQRQGSLDNFIRDWHDFFGLPNGDRDKLSDNELAYIYSSEGDEELRFTDETSGLGDVRLLLAWQWLAGDQRDVSLQAAVKAPTGEAADLTGSGGWDFSLAVSGQRNFILDQGSAAIWSGLGGSRLGTGGVLTDRAKNWAANAWLGVGWSPLTWFGLKLQIDGHTALYRSELRELGDPALILTMGGTLALGGATTVDIAIGEDLIVTASPDFTCHLSLSHRF